MLSDFSLCRKRRQWLKSIPIISNQIKAIILTSFIFRCYPERKQMLPTEKAGDREVSFSNQPDAVGETCSQQRQWERGGRKGAVTAHWGQPVGCWESQAGGRVSYHKARVCPRLRVLAGEQIGRHRHPRAQTPTLFPLFPYYCKQKFQIEKLFFLLEVHVILPDSFVGIWL